MRSVSARYSEKAESAVEELRSLVPTCRKTVVEVEGIASTSKRGSAMQAQGCEMKAGVPEQRGSKCWYRYLVWESPITTVVATVHGNFRMMSFDVVLAALMVENSLKTEKTHKERVKYNE